MFKSKKGILAFAVVLVLMLTFGAILIGGHSKTEVVANIGGKQINMLSAYAEADKVMEYVKLSAKYSASLAVQEVGTSAECFYNLNEDAFMNAFKQNMIQYLDAYNSTDPELDVSALAYSYGYDIQDNTITIECFSRNPGIVIKSNKINFNYTALGYVKMDFTCSEYQKRPGKKVLLV